MNPTVNDYPEWVYSAVRLYEEDTAHPVNKHSLAALLWDAYKRGQQEATKRLMG